MVAWLSTLWDDVAPYVEKLEFWRGYEQEFTTLLIFALGVAGYTALVFAFYQNLSRRDLFPMSKQKGGRGRLTRMAEIMLLFPAFSFLFFAVIAAALFVMNKSSVVTTSTTVLLAASVVVSVRLTAFMSESMANDLAKLLPLSLLAVLVVDPSYVTWSSTWARVQEVPTLIPLAMRFFAFLVCLEVVLHTTRAAIQAIRGRVATPSPRHVSREALAKQLSEETLRRSVPVREGAKDGPAAETTTFAELK